MELFHSNQQATHGGCAVFACLFTCRGVPVSRRRFLDWYMVPNVCANLLCAFFIRCPSSTIMYCHVVFRRMCLSWFLSAATRRHGNRRTGGKGGGGGVTYRKDVALFQQCAFRITTARYRMAHGYASAFVPITETSRTHNEEIHAISVSSKDNLKRDALG